jgi:putative flavoprotein involved in K+ transport
MNESIDVIVIGGGQAGLATGYHLGRRGLSFRILESSGEATGSWPHYYNSLKLFSPAKYSSLPGLPFPGDPNRYPVREEVIAYLKHYAEYFQLPILTHQHVATVEREGKRFIVQTTLGVTYRVKAVVSATGSFHNPYMPSIPGQELYQGQIMHSCQYRNEVPHRDHRIVIVGRGNSAIQIAVELSEVCHTSIAVLKPIEFKNQIWLGKDFHYWLIVTGIDKFPFWRFGKKAPNPSAVVDLQNYQQKITAGIPDQRAMFTSFYENGVVWSDGMKEQVDTVIFATGYRSNFAYLSNLDALDKEGKPLQKGGVSTVVRGLYYMGLYGQRNFSSATLRGVGMDARYIVNKLEHSLNK